MWGPRKPPGAGRRSAHLQTGEIHPILWKSPAKYRKFTMFHPKDLEIPNKQQEDMGFHRRTTSEIPSTWTLEVSESRKWEHQQQKWQPGGFRKKKIGEPLVIIHFNRNVPYQPFILGCQTISETTKTSPPAEFPSAPGVAAHGTPQWRPCDMIAGFQRYSSCRKTCY